MPYLQTNFWYVGDIMVSSFSMVTSPLASVGEERFPFARTPIKSMVNFPFVIGTGSTKYKVVSEPPMTVVLTELDT